MRTSSDATPNRLSSRAIALAVSTIWSEILGVEPAPDIDLNFFDAGGDSLRLLRLKNALNERFGLDLSGVDLFEHTTVRQLTSFIDSQLP